MDQDPPRVDNELSWLRRCGEAHGPELFFNSMAVIDGYDDTSCFKSLSVFFRCARARLPFRYHPGW